MDNPEINVYDTFFTEVTDESEEEQEVMCDNCSEVLQNDIQLAKHKKEFHDDHTCNECGQVVHGHKKLRDHVRNHKKAACPDCNKQVNKKRLSEHLAWCRNGQQNTRKKDLSCGTCTFVARTTKRLEAHMRTHEVRNIIMHSCGYCDYKSKRPRDVRRHEKQCKAKLRQQPPANGQVSNEELVDLFSDMHTSITDFNQMLAFFKKKFGSAWFEQGSMKCVQDWRLSWDILEYFLHFNSTRTYGSNWLSHLKVS